MTDTVDGMGDAGPARLVALMTLAVHAQALEHPRAGERIEGSAPQEFRRYRGQACRRIRNLWSGVR
jgi:hypothetical protein